MLNADSPLPLYHQLAELLAAQIRDGAYPDGARLPSEHALSASHGVARPTVRQATDVLLRRGLVERRRGAGTFVRTPPPQVDVFGLGGTLRGLRDSGLPIETAVLQPPTPVDLPDTALAGVDGTADGAPHPFAGRPALSMQRLFRLSGRPVLLEKLWLNPTLFAPLQDRELEGQSLSRVVQEELFLTPQRARQQFQAVLLGGRDGRLLGLRSPTPVLLLSRSIDFAPGGRPAPGAIYSELYCRTDRVAFSQTLGGVDALSPTPAATPRS